MHPYPPLLVLAGIVILCLTVVSGSKPDSCTNGQYYSPIDKKCEKCTACPTNQIIINPCTAYSNTKCGPFNLNDFSENGNELPHHSVLDEFHEEDSYYSLDADSKKNEALSSRKNSRGRDRNSSATVKEDQEYWRTLAFALIGLLSLLILAATVIILLACRKLHRATMIKQPEEAGLDDADSGYVVIRAIRIAADARPGSSDLTYTREDYTAHPPLLGAPSSDTDQHPVIVRGIPSRPRHLCFLPRLYKPRRQLLQCATDAAFETDSISSSCSNHKARLDTVA